MVKNLPAVQETRVGSLSLEDSLEKIPWLLQYSCLENSMGRACWATVQGVAKSWAQPSDRHTLLSDWGSFLQSLDAWECLSWTGFNFYQIFLWIYWNESFFFIQSQWFSISMVSDFQTLNKLYIHRIKPTGHDVFFTGIVGFSVLTFCRRFQHQCS